MSQKYLALTIGPIYKTISKARHTRELWAASYTFSYLMKEICRALPNKQDILVPAISGALDELFLCTDKDLLDTGAGLFPDRLIMKSDNTSFEELNKIVEGVLVDFAHKVAKELKREDQKATIVTVFKEYFQLYTLEVETNENLIETIMPYLDSMELQRNFSQKEDNVLGTFFFRISESFLIKDAFGIRKKHFSSLVEIATKHFENVIQFPELPIITDENEGQDLDFSIPDTDESYKKKLDKYSDDLDKRINELSIKYNPNDDTIENPFLPCYKYVAFVQADGDKVGSIIKELANKSEEELLGFSKKLYLFSKNAVKEISRYGGMNIYAGGDDLLFFAPVRCGEETIFDLLKRLDNLLKETLKGYQNHTPSMSFGTSISHFKAPMYEVLKDAAFQLFGVAKQPNDKPKNALAFRVEKHSGQGFASKIKLTSQSFIILQALLAMNQKNNAVDLRGITHDLMQRETELMATHGIPERVNNFIENNFNESIHQKEGKIFLEKVKALILASVNEANADHSSTENVMKEAIKNTHVILRTYLFLTSKELK
ncbi:type III-B CRISPR-associated protein Cas10/Cmr2 [Arcicella aquatica]|uniref:Type III-B CRISPR-associated protein Cas10/Cmr2 n=1 Tax=Arcicella aquatica TaxID=217141 RepID=A0ABU5QTB5_9BACT|nr:type III-B CRISPR-associated protein Cas10/Cmr2 [Arcicella aquatica]MEA5260333.1 type III-B CRISPR-associated protein Cas10/Cmr2 [Arcicella aquatica]